ncbi:FimV/HubP family polar landmark protein, partial [Salinisphaera orenii]
MPTIRRFGAGLAVLLCLGHAGAAFALGFGDLRLESALNEPLDARVALTALSADEADTLSVRVAPPAMFERFGIERTALADDIRIDVTATGSGQAQARLTTRAPVREPFVRVLLEARTDGGRALREYTVLLDPPGRAPAAAGRSAPPNRRAPARREARTPVESVSDPTTAAGRDTAESYGPIRSGDTLFSIAARLRYPDVTREQMQVALYRENPQAFGKSMNVLRRGATLSVPGRAEVAAIDASAARSTIRTERPSSEPAPTAAAENGDTPAAAEDAAPSSNRARLRLQPPSVEGSAADGSTDEPRAAGEGASGFGRLSVPAFADAADTGSRLSLDTGTGRAASDTVDRPAGNGSDTVRAEPEGDDETGSRAPMTVDASDPQNGDVTGGTTAVDSNADRPQAIDTEASGPESETAGAASSAGDDAGPAVAGAGSAANSGDSDAREADAASETADESGADGDENSRPIADAGERDVAAAGEGGGLFSIRNLLLLALLAALVGLLIAWQRRRQYRPVALDFGGDDADYETHAATAGSTQTTAGEPPPAARAATPAASSVPNTGAALDDADRQMEIGLFDEARATLDEALARAPDDAALQDKRIELEYLAGDANAFGDTITRFQSALAGSGVRWAGVAAMGRVLRPDDPRFASGRAAEPARPAAPAPVQERDPADHDATDAPPSVVPAPYDSAATDHDRASAPDAVTGGDAPVRTDREPDIELSSAYDP